MNPLLGVSSVVAGPFRGLLMLTHAVSLLLFTAAFLSALRYLVVIPGDRRADLEGRTIQALRAGFLMLALALILHSSWTTYAWGEFWAWDPAKNLGLVVWLAYGGVLHIHHVPALKGRPVVLASLGVWIFLALAMSALWIFGKSAPFWAPRDPAPLIERESTPGRFGP